MINNNNNNDNDNNKNNNTYLISRGGSGSSGPEAYSILEFSFKQRNTKL